MGLVAWLALRSLVAQRLSLTVLVIAVAIGVGFQIPNTANLAGSSAALLEEELTWGAGDVRVEPRDTPRFATTADIAAQIERTLPDARAVPLVVLPGGIAVSGSRFISAVVFGVDFDSAPLRIAAGAAPAPGELGVVLGSALARRLGAQVGDEVELRVMLDATGASDGDATASTLIVRGIAGNSAATSSVFVERALLAGELREPGSASMLAVHLPDHDAAPAAARALEAALPEIRAVEWQRDDPALPAIVRANRTIERVSYAMIVVAITIPLLALLYIRTLRTRREIAVLRAVGFTRRAVFAIHLLQSIAIGCIGSALGASIGAAALTVFDRYPIFTWETLVVRPVWSASTFVGPIAAALAASVLAGAIAAWHASRTEPARVLQQLD